MKGDKGKENETFKESERGKEDVKVGRRDKGEIRKKVRRVRRVRMMRSEKGCKGEMNEKDEKGEKSKKGE